MIQNPLFARRSCKSRKTRGKRKQFSVFFFNFCKVPVFSFLIHSSQTCVCPEFFCCFRRKKKWNRNSRAVRYTLIKKDRYRKRGEKVYECKNIQKRKKALLPLISSSQVKWWRKYGAIKAFAMPSLYLTLSIQSVGVYMRIWECGWNESTRKKG